MQEWIDKVGYGNRDIGGGIDRFWLSGALRISAVEQIAFLRRLAAGTLPFSARSQETVRRITIQESAPDYVLHRQDRIGDARGHCAKGRSRLVRRLGRARRPALVLRASISICRRASTMRRSAIAIARPCSRRSARCRPTADPPARDAGRENAAGVALPSRRRNRGGAVMETSNAPAVAVAPRPRAGAGFSSCCWSTRCRSSACCVSAGR